MADEAAVAQFTEVTGASKEAAKFFLDSSGGELGAAIEQFFATGGEFEAGGDAPAMEDEELLDDDEPEHPVVPALLRQGQGPPAPLAAPTSVAAAAFGGGGVASGSSAGRRPPVNRGNVRSLADLAAGKEDSDEDDRNEYYAGGEKSGQVVKGAPNPREHVEDLFNRARRAGAQDGPMPQVDPAPAGPSRAKGAFQGAARTLAGDSPAEQQQPPAQQQPGGVPSSTAPATTAAAAADPAAPQQPIVHTIAFYSNGIFTVDDGEPRRLDDPANRAFLDSMARGECPAELEPASRATPVNVNLVRHEKEYAPPAQPRYRAFSGTGRVLTADDDNAASGEAAAEASTSAPPPLNLDVPWEGADEGQPTTSLQLRLADGTRMVARFNTSHTVADIRRFICAARPDMPTTYRLVTAFPPAQLDDNAATIAGAGLANAVVIQKL